MDVKEIIDKLGPHESITVDDSLIMADKLINKSGYNNIMCSISGGADSDIVLDICSKVDVDKKIRYVWFDTGVEYQATKDHLRYLENRYGVEIETVHAVKPIPLCCKEYGQPFLSKFVSEAIGALQKRNFKWEDKPYEELLKEYPDVSGYLKWWCNAYPETSELPERFNIHYNKWLKEFMLENPPTFKVSKSCCDWAKKKVKKKLIKENNFDLEIIGVRRGEGGVRAKSYKTCFSGKDAKLPQYRPVFWYRNEDKEEYEKLFNIVHSDCYKKWGFKRTGCVCCPYSKQLNENLESTRIHEPKLYVAANNIFKDSYDYTKRYHEFRVEKERQSKGVKKLF